ncbi:MAG: Gfo/Idh/MocA family oxidoreductase [Planctomycetales bacterium]|nr:Gfo/Idh/MocA family oxidoreductase [Planctomycetales bacterium]
MTRAKVAVVGAGHLGRIHARLLKTLPDAELVGVVDVDPRAREAARQELNVPVHADPARVISLADAAIIATPTSTHCDMALPWLKAGRHVLIEKPLALDSTESQRLVAAAEAHGRILQVGHVERFNPAFQRAAESMGIPMYLEMRRLGPNSFRSTDIGAVLDLMIHDIDLVLELVREHVVHVEGFTTTVFGGHEDLARARIEFANGAIAELHASRCHSEPVRTMTAVDERATYQIDLGAGRVEQLTARSHDPMDFERLSGLERKHLQEKVYDTLLEKRLLEVPAANPILEEQREFLAAIRGQGTPRVSGQSALYAIQIAERVLEDAEERRVKLAQFAHRSLVIPAGPLWDSETRETTRKAG